MYYARQAVFEDDLMHYGVAGMKWGIRKDPLSSYKSKMKNKSEKYFNKTIKRLDGQSRRSLKRSKIYSKLGLQKLSEGAKSKSNAFSNMSNYQKEMKKYDKNYINRMDENQMRLEKNEIRKIAAKNLAFSIGASALSTFAANQFIGSRNGYRYTVVAAKTNDRNRYRALRRRNNDAGRKAEAKAYTKAFVNGKPTRHNLAYNSQIRRYQTTLHNKPLF